MTLTDFFSRREFKQTDLHLHSLHPILTFKLTFLAELLL